MVESVLDVKAMLEMKRQGEQIGRFEAKNISDDDLMLRIKDETNPDTLTRWIIAAATANSAA